MTQKPVSNNKLAAICKSKPALLGAALILILIIIAVIWIVVARNPADKNNQNNSDVNFNTKITSPYGIDELMGDFDLNILNNVSFVSVIIEDETAVSHMVAGSTEVAKSFVKAVQKAEKVEPAPAPSTSSKKTIIVFKLSTEEFVIFEANLEENLLLRDNKALRAKESLESLVAAIATAQQ